MAVGLAVGGGVGGGEDVYHADAPAEVKLGIQVLVEVDDAGVGDELVVLALDAALDVEAVAWGEVALDVLRVGEAYELVDGEPVPDLGVLAKAEFGIADERVDRAAAEPVARVEKGGGRVEVVERHIGLDAVFFAAGEEFVVVGDALGDRLGIVAVGEDAAPGDRDADRVDAVLGREADVLLVAVVEIARGVGQEAALGDEVIVPHRLALAGDLRRPLGLVGGGRGAPDESPGELLDAVEV